MNFSLFKNDKTTVKDEIVLFLIIILSIAIGSILILIKPSFGIIQERHTVVCGVFIDLLGVMLIPGLIYRILTNNDEKEI